MNGTNGTHQNVLIAGAGPVGLAMAADLARYGISVRLVEKAPERTDKSKALSVWSRTLELMDRMNCAPLFLTTGRKVTAVNITAGKKPIAKIKVDGVTTPHPYALMIPQCDTEQLLGDFVISLGVKIERNIELTNFVASADKVTSTLRHLDGTEEAFESGWLIGCDGAHSTVRHKLGMEFAGGTMPSSWIIADVHLSNMPNPEEILIAWHTEGILAVFPIHPPRYRVIADAGLTQAGVAPASPTMEDVQAILDARGPGGIRVSDPLWLTGFTINERKVSKYRSGRVFLMGDAAHIHSPAGGQGMNTGMQDAFNLAWKLALVSRGMANEEILLGSYSSERSSIAEDVLKGAGKMTEVALMTGDFKQSIRNHIASFVFALSPVQKKVSESLTEVSIGYPKSPLNGGGEYPGEGPREGERAPVDADLPRVGAGDKPWFALFAEEVDGRGGELISRYPNLLEPTLREPFHQCGLWLVRPDGYVALATQRDRWDDVARYLDVLTKGKGQ
jgi:2-polyprenyl-6-methoxyphenol hydroxylase-like FAD-dependent oxidoreductase